MIENRFKKPDEDNTDKHCELFILNIKNTEHYSTVVRFMKQFKSNQNKANAFQIFINLHAYIKSTGNKSLEEEFSRCLVSQAFISEENKQKPKNSRTNQPNQSKKQYIVPIYSSSYSKPQPLPPQNYEQINEQVFMKRIHSIPHFNMFAKIVELYLTCIITLTQLKEFSARFLSKNVYTYFIDLASLIEGPRRKGSRFVSLNRKLESQLKNRIGASYVQMPDGYANHCNDHTLPQHVKETLNRQWVSMPLGTQFKNMKKNQYEEEMFKLEQDRFQIDSTIMNFRKSLDHLASIQNQNEFKHSNILQRTLYRIYGSGQAYDFLQRMPAEAVKIISFRVDQKLKEIQICRRKSLKTWEDAAIKNFQKSLDHRSYYFQSYQKKYNLNPSRWDKETQFRHQLYINPLTPNPESYNTNIDNTVDTFEHVTRQKCIESSVVNLDFQKTNSFIKFPQNKILYVFDFGDSEILSDVIGVIYNKVNKKNSLQYLLLKIFKIDVCKYVDNFQDKMNKFQKFRSTLDSKNNDSFDEEDHITTKKDRKRAPDITQQFHQIIEEDLQYTTYKQSKSPFEGPESSHVFIGTRSQYHFVRYLLIIYQRFTLAKQITNKMDANENKCPFQLGQKYQRFKYLLVNKSKDSSFDDSIRKIFQKNAFLFLTLSKLIQRVARNINNLDELSTNIVRSDTKYYDLGIKILDRFDFKSEMEQIMRIYHQHGIFYRFSWVSPYLYISSWNSIYKQWKNRSQTIPRLNHNFKAFLSKPRKASIQKESGAKKRSFQEMESQYVTAPNDMLLFQKGSEFFKSGKSTRVGQSGISEGQLKRVKRVKQMFNI